MTGSGRGDRETVEVGVVLRNVHTGEGGDEEARPTLREKIADELRSTDECSSLDVASRQEYLDDADAVLRIVREHRAGERADAIPAEAKEAAAIAMFKRDWPDGVSDGRVGDYDAYAEAALTAAAPFMGNGADQELVDTLREALIAARDGLIGRCLGLERVQADVIREVSEQIEVVLRAAHPEADRAPEGEVEVDPVRMDAYLKGLAAGRSDRAPGEVETERVARLANPAYDAATNDETRAQWRRDASRYIAALDAARRRSRDDTATDVDALLYALRIARKGADLGTLQTIDAVLARFGGAGRAEDDDR